jgi:3-ketosteroid 9alpha-monooxygenase subunit A
VTFARGWYCIGFSDEIAAGVARPARYFGQDLVVYRTASGVPVVLDAHCPHLGAHLGHGGVVVGEDLRCPFHAWTFGVDGRCSGIPYSDHIPRRAFTRRWPTDEVGGLVLVWYGSDAPEYTVPPSDGHGDPAWSAFSHSMIRIRTQGREIVENVADLAHFPTVHGTVVDRFENSFEGHRAIQRSWGTAYPRGGGKDAFTLEAVYHGPAIQLTKMEGVLASRLVNAHIPIDEHELELRFGVMLRVHENAALMERIRAAYVDNLRVGFHEDVRIWENKRWREPPVLAAGDGPIGKLRRWYQQFYESV